MTYESETLLTYVRELRSIDSYNSLNAGTAYCIWSVMSSFSIVNRWSSSLCLFHRVLLKRDQEDWDWRLRFDVTPNAIGCIRIWNSWDPWYGVALVSRKSIVSFVGLFCNRDISFHRWNHRSLLQKSPTKETILCKKDLWFNRSYWPKPPQMTYQPREIYQTHTVLIHQIVGTVTQNLEIVSKTLPAYQNSAHGIFDWYRVITLIVIPLRILVRLVLNLKGFRNNLKILCRFTCNWLYNWVRHLKLVRIVRYMRFEIRKTHCNTLQHTATHCNPPTTTHIRIEQKLPLYCRKHLFTTGKKIYNRTQHSSQQHVW